MKAAFKIRWIVIGSTICEDCFKRLFWIVGLNLVADLLPVCSNLGFNLCKFVAEAVLHSLDVKALMTPIALEIEVISGVYDVFKAA